MFWEIVDAIHEHLKPLKIDTIHTTPPLKCDSRGTPEIIQLLEWRGEIQLWSIQLFNGDWIFWDDPTFITDQYRLTPEHYEDVKANFLNKFNNNPGLYI